MSEKNQFRDSLIKLALVGVFAILYSMGGSADYGGMKWLRRFLAPAIMVGGMFWFSKDWRCLPQLPLMFASLSLGYGSDIEIWKIIKRGIFGLANGISSSGENLLNKRWLLAGFQTVLLVGAYICFGVFNPFPDARVEELVLGFLIAFIPIMSSRKKE